MDKWQSDYILLKSNLEILKTLVDNSCTSIDNLIEYLELSIKVNMLIEKTYCYAKRHVDIDSTLEEYKIMMNDILILYSDFQNVSNKFENLLIVNNDNVLEYLKNKNMSKYQRYIYLILRKLEYITNKKNFNYSKELHELKEFYRELVNDKIDFKTINIDGKEVEVNRNNYDNLIINDSQRVRKNVFDSYNQAFIELVDSIFDIYKRKLLLDINCAKEEKYDSLLNKKLFELELDEKIVINLIKTIDDNLEVIHKYIKLKKV